MNFQSLVIKIGWEKLAQVRAVTNIFGWSSLPLALMHLDDLHLCQVVLAAADSL
jgi:hypothetical protein